MGDQPKNILAEAADKVLVTLKNDRLSSRDKKKETELFLGALTEERFSLLVNLEKNITDFGYDPSWHYVFSEQCNDMEEGDTEDVYSEVRGREDEERESR